MWMECVTFWSYMPICWYLLTHLKCKMTIYPAPRIHCHLADVLHRAYADAELLPRLFWLNMLMKLVYDDSVVASSGWHLWPELQGALWLQPCWWMPPLHWPLPLPCWLDRYVSALMADCSGHSRKFWNTPLIYHLVDQHKCRLWCFWELITHISPFSSEKYQTFACYSFSNVGIFSFYLIIVQF